MYFHLIKQFSFEVPGLFNSVYRSKVNFQESSSNNEGIDGIERINDSNQISNEISNLQFGVQTGEINSSIEEIKSKEKEEYDDSRSISSTSNSSIFMKMDLVKNLENQKKILEKIETCTESELLQTNELIHRENVENRINFKTSSSEVNLINNSLIKTSDCTKFVEIGYCKYGTKCFYIHSKYLKFILKLEILKKSYLVIQIILNFLHLNHIVKMSLKAVLFLREGD